MMLDGIWQKIYSNCRSHFPEITHKISSSWWCQMVSGERYPVVEESSFPEISHNSSSSWWHQMISVEKSPPIVGELIFLKSVTISLGADDTRWYLAKDLLQLEVRNFLWCRSFNLYNFFWLLITSDQNSSTDIVLEWNTWESATIPITYQQI